MNAQTKPSDVWVKELGVILHDQDGWKDKPFSEFITQQEFEERMINCQVAYPEKAMERFRLKKV
jgi:hypothetical protein